MVIEVDPVAMVAVPSVTVIVIGTVEPTAKVLDDFTAATKMQLLSDASSRF